MWCGNHNHVVVDTEIGVVEVFVFTAYVDKASIRQFRDRAAKAIEAPHRTKRPIRIFDILNFSLLGQILLVKEELSSRISATSSGNHVFP